MPAIPASKLIHLATWWWWRSIISAEASSLGTNNGGFVEPPGRSHSRRRTRDGDDAPPGDDRGRTRPGVGRAGAIDRTGGSGAGRRRGVGVPDPREDDPGRFDGARTRFGRRERRGADGRDGNARVRNSYLEIVLEDAVLDRLHDLVRRMGREWEGDDDACADDRPTIVSKKQSKRRLAVEPRSRNSLHMTYFFAGKVLGDMTSEELRRWEYFVRKCVSEHDDGLFSVDDHTLRFKSLVTFPPRRQNLIVAVFEPSSALDDLYEELCGAAMMERECDVATAGTATGDGGKDYEFPLLRSLTRKQREQRKRDASPGWIAHVTLGKLVGGSSEDVRRLNEWLGNRNHVNGDIASNTSDDDGVEFISSTLEETKTHSEPNDLPLAKTEKSSTKSEKSSCILESNIDVLGLKLGGPMPGHVDIDWNFPLKKR